MIPRSHPNWPPYVWHHRVHTQKRRERLFYWRLGFLPTYERDSVAAGIDMACERHGVRGVIAYELFGSHDLLLRAWLPEGCSFGDFDLTLTAELKPAGLSACDQFEVRYMVRHWPFLGPDGTHREPEDRSIYQLEDSDIHEIDTKFPTVRPELLERLRAQGLLFTFEGVADRAEAAGEFDPRPGIKFAVIVSAAPDIRTAQVHSLEQQVVEILDAATSIRQRSLYSGSGFGHFLIMGRVDYESFHAIHSELIAQINAAAVREPHGARTMTHICGQRGYHTAREALSVGARSDEPDGELSRLRRTGSAAIVDPDRVLESGYVFGDRFEILEHLGGGGFANVYRTYDRFERVERALKIFKSAQRELALREIAALRKVTHPNVVKVFWGDHEGPRWYLVCEFIEGVSLDRCTHGDDIWALEIVVQVLKALEAVHPNDTRIGELESLAGAETISLEDFRELQKLRAIGLVHRDVKPENIMVGADGHVTLVDFNIASPALEPGDTRSGTPEYQAPDAGIERWEPADDLFACGVVLYEMLVGSHPYPDARPLSGAEPIDPLTIRPDLRRSLARILCRACASARSERHQTARGLRIELEAELAALRAIEGGFDVQADHIARLLQNRRTERRIGIKTLADTAGVPRAEIEEMERGETYALPQALRLAHELGLTLDEMLGDGARKPPNDTGASRNGNESRGDDGDEEERDCEDESPRGGSPEGGRPPGA